MKTKRFTGTWGFSAGRNALSHWGHSEVIFCPQSSRIISMLKVLLRTVTELPLSLCGRHRGASIFLEKHPNLLHELNDLCLVRRKGFLPTTRNEVGSSSKGLAQKSWHGHPSKMRRAKFVHCQIIAGCHQTQMLPGICVTCSERGEDSSLQYVFLISCLPGLLHREKMENFNL